MWRVLIRQSSTIIPLIARPSFKQYMQNWAQLLLNINIYWRITHVRYFIIKEKPNHALFLFVFFFIKWAVVVNLKLIFFFYPLLFHEMNYFLKTVMLTLSDMRGECRDKRVKESRFLEGNRNTEFFDTQFLFLFR